MGPLSPARCCVAAWMQVRVLTGAVDHDGTFRTRSLRDDWLQMRGSRRTTQPGLRRAVLGGPSVWPLQLCHQHIPVGPAMVSPPVGPAMVSPSELPTGTTETSGFSANQSAALGTWVFSTTLLSVPEPSSLKGPELTNPSVSLCVKKQGSNRFVVCPVPLCCLPNGGHGAGAQVGSWMVLCTGLPERGRWLGAWVRGFTFVYDGEL